MINGAVATAAGLGIETINLIKGLMAYVLFLVVFYLGTKKNAEWTTSIRSVITMILVFEFCALAGQGKIEPKDFLLIVSLVMNFYFLAKQRSTGDGNGNGDGNGTVVK